MDVRARFNADMARRRGEYPSEKSLLLLFYIITLERNFGDFGVRE